MIAATLVFNRAHNKMRCSYCIDKKKSNVFTSGCGDFLKDYVAKVHLVTRAFAFKLHNLVTKAVTK